MHPNRAFNAIFGEDHCGVSAALFGTRQKLPKTTYLVSILSHDYATEASDVAEVADLVEPLKPGYR
jgi:hypothetical protein